MRRLNRVDRGSFGIWVGPKPKDCTFEAIHVYYPEII